MRWASRTIRSVLCLSLGLLAASQERAFATDRQDEDRLFVVGNTLFTVYHELGHALIDLLDLPVIGQEENAVDGFAAVTMIPATPDVLRDDLIVAVADGWRAMSAGAAERGKRRYWGEHALDEQRFYRVVCLMVGSDQDGFFDFALGAGLPVERIETCSEDFAAMKTGWRRLLEPHRPGSDVAPSQHGPMITLLFDQPSPRYERLLDLLWQDRVLEDDILDFADDILLPEPITIRFADCNDINAYWSPKQREVTVCYALIDEYDAIVREAFTR